DATSPYTSSVLEALRSDRKLSISSALTKASKDVVVRSDGRQIPNLATSMNADLFLWRQHNSRKRFALIVWVEDAGFQHPRLLAPMHDADRLVKLLREAGYSSNEILVLPDPALEELDNALFVAKELMLKNGTQRSEEFYHPNSLYNNLSDDSRYSK